MSRSLYDVLGVARDADTEEIRKRYRALARENHPDLNPDDEAAEERFKEIAQAFAILSDTEKRRDYDEFGEDALEGGFDADAARRARDEFMRDAGTSFSIEDLFGPMAGGGQMPGGGPGRQRSGDADFGDLFDRIFGAGAGAGAGAPMSARGHDREAALQLGFKEAALGCQRDVHLRERGFDGSVREDHIKVRIPKGAKDGDRLRLAGKGSPGHGGGQAGDLYVTLRVRPHAVFERRGDDLLLDVPISVREAILGGPIEIPTLEGRATVTVPPGTQGGTRLRLRGKGAPRRGSGHGDLIVRVQLRVPDGLDDEAREMIGKLERFEDPELRTALFREGS